MHNETIKSSKKKSLLGAEKLRFVSIAAKHTGKEKLKNKHIHQQVVTILNRIQEIVTAGFKQKVTNDNCHMKADDTTVRIELL